MFSLFDSKEKKLRDAAENGDLNKVTKYVKKGVNINTVDEVSYYLIFILYNY
jgi:hypothetical protein